jgi:hypothetical protein
VCHVVTLLLYRHELGLGHHVKLSTGRSMHWQPDSLLPTGQHHDVNTAFLCVAVGSRILCMVRSGLLYIEGCRCVVLYSDVCFCCRHHKPVAWQTGLCSSGIHACATEAGCCRSSRLHTISALCMSHKTTCYVLLVLLPRATCKSPSVEAGTLLLVGAIIV